MHRDDGGHPPFTMSSAKLETPEPRLDWVTQRYRSCSPLDTSSSWKVARKRRWLMCFTEAAGTTSPLCLCPVGRERHEEGSAWRSEPPDVALKDRILTTHRSHLHEEALCLGGLASSHTLEGGILPRIHLHVTQAGEVRGFRCHGTKKVLRRLSSASNLHCSPKTCPVGAKLTAGSLLESHLHSPAMGPSQEAHRDAPRVEPPSLQEPALPQGPVITEAMRELLVMEAGLSKEMGPPAPWCQQDTQVPPGCTPALTVPRSIPAQQHHHTAAPLTSTCTHSMDNSRARCHPSQGSPGARWRSPPRRGPVLPNRGVRRGRVVP